MSDTSRWKQELLGSGLPLEFDTARALVTRGFRVESDLKYSQTGAAGIRDFSVDLNARTPVPAGNPDRPAAMLDLLVECKHVRPGAAWLFLPDPNKPEDSPVMPGHTLRVVDKFSVFAMDAEATAGFDRPLPICYKGIQIDLEQGAVEDAELAHGLAQLRYAMPRLLAQNVTLSLGGDPDANLPLLFCPILLTNAPLLVAGRALSVEQVQQATELSDIAAEVPYLVMYCDYEPGFLAHCREEFRGLEALEREERTLLIEKRRAAHYGSDAELPVAMIESLIAGQRHWLHRLFTQFVVCTKPALPALVEAITAAARSAAAARKELP